MPLTFEAKIGPGMAPREVVSRRGQTLTLTEARLHRPPARKVPIAIGTRSEQVMRLAGECAPSHTGAGRRE